MEKGIGRDIVITGLQSWDISIGSNCKNIADEMRKNNRVLYVNPPKDMAVRVRERFSGSYRKANSHKPILQEVKPGLWVLTPRKTLLSINKVPAEKLFDRLNYHNNVKFASEIQKAIRQLGFQKVIHFCDSDMFRSFYLKDLLKPDLFIYYTRDNLLAVDYWKKNGERIEPALMKKADMVLANSQYLSSVSCEYNSEAHFIGQGCDISAFEQAHSCVIPDDIKNIPGPRVGYIGALNCLRLNISLLELLASKKSKLSFVFVGPEDAAFKQSKLHALNNVYFLGAKPQEQLPAYLNAFDVAINPQSINPLTIGNYPRKIDEYLAGGIPVVATNTKAMEMFNKHIFPADSNTQWLEQLEKSLYATNEDQRMERQNFARLHTWENNVSEIMKNITNYENKRAN